MDDLYSNLDNYDEGNIIAMLRSENTNLKSQIEGYAANVEKLQQDLDKLTSEYKRLELNYSSLLKTAKAEIERKTLIITNLNLQKDQLVLQKYQNKNTTFHRNRSYDKPNSNRDTNNKSEKDENPPPIPRNEPVCAPPDDKTPSCNESLKSKLLALSNSISPHIDARNEQNRDAKENHSKKESDTSKSTAHIQNRRKSVPAVRVETEHFSTDDEIPSTGSSKGHSRERTDEHPMDNNFRKSHSSRMSETSSLEDRNAGCNEPLSDAQKDRRYSRYDNNRFDRNRARDKSSHRYKRPSPEQYGRGYRDYNDSSHSSRRLEHERRRVENPSNDEYHHRNNREPCRNNLERNRSLHETERQYRSQEKYPMKHKIHHHYDETDNKKMKIDPQYRDHERDSQYRHHEQDPQYRQHDGDLQYRQYEGDSQYRQHDRDPQYRQHDRDPQYRQHEGDPQYRQHEGDPQYKQREGGWILHNERHFSEKRPYNFSSCESPDYKHPENSFHQIKEIKLTATTKLDDPRVSNRKYVLKNNENSGKMVISTTEGRNVNIIPVNKTEWGLNPVGMPEALLQKPLNTLHSAKQMDMEIKIPVVEIPMETSEIYGEGLESQKKFLKDKILVNKVDEVKDIEKASQKINNYKIPNLKKANDDNQILKNIKEVTSLVKPVHKSIDETNPFAAKSTTEKTSSKKNRQDTSFIQSNNELPSLACSDHYDTQKYADAKEVVVDDLKLSEDDDDGSDNNEQTIKVVKHIVKHKVDNQLEKGKDKSQTNNNGTVEQNINALKTCVDNVKSNNSDKQTEEKLKKVSVESSKNNGKRSKNKNKHKDTKAERASKDRKSSQVSEKTSKMEKEIEKKEDCAKDLAQISETTKHKKKEKKMKTKQIKTKFSELFDDSCSLISPEDLGLIAAPSSTNKLSDSIFCIEDAQGAPVSTAKLPDSVFCIEDAQEAADLNTVEIPKDSKSLENLCDKENLQNSDVTNIETVNNAYQKLHDSQNNDITELEAGDTVSHESIDKTKEVDPEIDEKVIESIYKNLEPEIPEKEKDFVKTIIISSGVQPQIESESQAPTNTVEPQILIASNNLALKALATSTPYKMWQSNEVQADTEAKPPDTSSNPIESRMAIVENSQTLHNSDTNALASQTNSTDVPDVRIIVSRRRRVLKK